MINIAFIFKANETGVEHKIVIFREKRDAS